MQTTKPIVAKQNLKQLKSKVIAMPGVKTWFYAYSCVMV